MPIRHSTFYKAIVRMAKAWEKLSVHNGHVDWSNGMPTIVVDEATGRINLSNVALGYTINPDGDNTAEIKINSGSIFGVYIAETKFVISGTDYIYIKPDGTFEVNPASVVAQTILYGFVESGGVIDDSQTWIWNVGNIGAMVSTNMGIPGADGITGDITIGSHTFTFANGYCTAFS